MRGLAPWAVLAAATGAAGWALGEAGVPSSYLFGGAAPRTRRRDRVAGAPRGPVARLRRGAGRDRRDARRLPAVLGALGRRARLAARSARERRHARRRASRRASRSPALHGRTRHPTAALGMVAGGASGIVGMADDLGGDDRLVAFMQYAARADRRARHAAARPVFFAGGTRRRGRRPATGRCSAIRRTGWSRWRSPSPARCRPPAVRVPAGTLLGPMLALGASDARGVTAFTVPPLLRETGVRRDRPADRAALHGRRPCAWSVACCCRSRSASSADRRAASGSRSCST